MKWIAPAGGYCREEAQDSAAIGWWALTREGPDMPNVPAMRESAWSRFTCRIKFVSALQWLNVVAALVTIIGIPIALIRITEGPAGTVLAILVCLLCALAWILLAVEEFRWHRKARYAEAQPSCHLAYHALRDASFALLSGADDWVICDYLKGSLHSLSAAFSLITGVHCRVCIKELICSNPKAEPKDRGLVTRTLCRSEEVPEPPMADSEDWITENSDFYLLFKNPEQRCFCRNNLPRLLPKGYRNSHWTSDVIESKCFPYVATIVWPIRKSLPKMGQSVGALHEDHDILGYLCVDSSTKNVFEERYDFGLGAAFADTLYSLLRTWREWKTVYNTPGIQGEADGL
jgi:hypothetical protein